MCRIFGFRSIISSQVHSSLVSADNALVLQSEKHPDGWGVAYYVADTPHIIKSSASAFADSLFQKVSGIVSSKTVIAHLRKATLGSLETTNTHPFQFGRWVFAHNGNIKNFANHRKALFDLVDEDLQKFVLGETDSELIFYILLTYLRKKEDIHSRVIPVPKLKEATQEAVAAITKIIGPFCPDDQAENTETFLTFLLSNGQAMVAHQGGKKLFYSTFKSRCSERDTCPHFAPRCEKPVYTGKVSHLLFSSEPLGGENFWKEMEVGEIIAIDEKMNVAINP